MDRGSWQAAVRGGHKQSDMTEQLTLLFFFQRCTMLLGLSYLINQIVRYFFVPGDVMKKNN